MNKKIILGLAAIIVLSLITIGLYKQLNKIQDKEIIKIGAVLPLTGKLSDAGNTVLAGLTIAVDSLNMLHEKYKYEIVSEDTRSEAATAIVAYRKLKDINKIKIFFTTTTSHVMSIKPQALKDSVILFGIASHPDVTKENNGLIFRPNNTSSEESVQIAQFIKKEVSKNNRILLFYYNSEFGFSFKQQLETLLDGIKVNSLPYEDDPMKLNNLITSDLLQNKTNSIIVIGFTPTMGTLIKKLREAKYEGKIITNTGFFNPSIINAAGEAAKGIYYVDNNFPYQKMTDMEKKAMDTFKVHFSALSYIAYFSLKAINQAIVNTSSTNNRDIAKYLRSTQKITIENTTFTSHLDGSITPELLLRENTK